MGGFHKCRGFHGIVSMGLYVYGGGSMAMEVPQARWMVDVREKKP